MHNEFNVDDNRASSYLCIVEWLKFNIANLTFATDAVRKLENVNTFHVHCISREFRRRQLQCEGTNRACDVRWDAQDIFPSSFRLFVSLILRAAHYSRWISSHKFPSSNGTVVDDLSSHRCIFTLRQWKNVVKRRQISRIRCSLIY